VICSISAELYYYLATTAIHIIIIIILILIVVYRFTSISEATRWSFYCNYYYLENTIKGSSVDVRAQWDKLPNAYSSGRIYKGRYFFFTRTITIKKKTRG